MSNMWKPLLSLVLLATIFGCRDAGHAPPRTSDPPGNVQDPPKKARISVQAPGVDVDVDRQKGKVNVQAPGVDIQIDKK